MASKSGCSRVLMGCLLVVVIGDGRLVVPVDFAIRRPDPTGPGAPCRDKLRWARTMLDERLVACAPTRLAAAPSAGGGR